MNRSPCTLKPPIACSLKVDISKLSKLKFLSREFRSALSTSVYVTHPVLTVLLELLFELENCTKIHSENLEPWIS